jgi:hypothetical protein
MFSLPEFTKVKVLDVVVLSQKNRPPGANPGVRLNLRADLANHVLNGFDTRLREALFTNGGESDSDKAKRQTLPGVEPVSDLPNLTPMGRHVRKIPWTEELTGYGVEIDHGLGGKSNLQLEDATLDSFRFAPKDGGTVASWWSLEVVDVTKVMLGELGMLKSREVPMKFAEPTVAQQEIDVSPAKKAKGKSADAEAAWPFPNDKPRAPADPPPAQAGKKTVAGKAIGNGTAKASGKSAGEIFAQQHGGKANA